MEPRFSRPGKPRGSRPARSGGSEPRSGRSRCERPQRGASRRRHPVSLRRCDRSSAAEAATERGSRVPASCRDARLLQSGQRPPARDPSTVAEAVMRAPSPHDHAGLPVLAVPGVELVAGHVQLSERPAQKVTPDREGVLGMEREGLPVSTHARNEAAASMFPLRRECRKESSRLTTVQIGQSCGHRGSTRLLRCDAPQGPSGGADQTPGSNPQAQRVPRGSSRRPRLGYHLRRSYAGRH